MEAAPVLAAPLAEVVEELPLDFDEAGEEDAGVVAVSVVAGVVAAGVVADEMAGVLAPETELAGVLAPEAVEMLPVLVKHALLPELIVKGADSAVVPVLSRMVRPIEVPAAILVLHVREVPVC